MKRAAPGRDAACACGSGAAYPSCCGPLHAGGAAASAEALMRSRYSVYALGLGPYLSASWHASKRPPAIDLDAATKWLGLDIREHRLTGTDTAVVEFVARYRVGGGCAARLHERSRFVREDGRWFYVDGEIF